MSTDKQTDELRGRKLPRAKPVTLTFYDSLPDYPYTTTFYVRDDATLEQIRELIRCVDALSDCVLGKYKIGYEEYILPGFRERIAEIGTIVMGTFKWRIVYLTENSITRSHTIPGRNIETSFAVTKKVQMKGGKKPDLEHPKWQDFLKIFKAICLTKKGYAIRENVRGDITISKWPPKGAKKRG